MTTARAIIAGAIILALGIVGAAYTFQTTAPRFSVTNLGGGYALRLDARSGEVLSCINDRPCEAVTGAEAIARAKAAELPPGFEYEDAASNAAP